MRNPRILLYGPAEEATGGGILADLPSLIGAYDFATAAIASGAGNNVPTVVNDAPDPGLGDLSAPLTYEPVARNPGGIGYCVEFARANSDFMVAAFTDLTEVSGLTVVGRLAVRDNPGSYKGFFSVREGSDPDYQFGFTAAMGPTATTAFDYLTLYTPGAATIPGPDQLTDSVAFDTVCTLTLVRDPASELLRLFLNGAAQDTRSFSGGGDCDAGNFYVGGRGESAAVAAFASCYLVRVIVCAAALSGADRLLAETLVESGW